MVDSEPAGKKQLFCRALRKLTERILSGEFQPGRPISESAASELIGTSRTPVREAMSHLVGESLLERTPAGRCIVRQVADEDAIEPRGILEGTVLALAAEQGADRARSAECRRPPRRDRRRARRHEARFSFEGCAELIKAFLHCLIRLSSSPTLEREAARILWLPFALPNWLLQSQLDLRDVRRSLFVAQARYEAMVTAVAQGEGARADALGGGHARLARANLEPTMSDDRVQAGAAPDL